MGLGSFKAVSLSKAREKAEQALAEIDAGKDPRLERDARRASMITFGEVADQVLAHKAESNDRAEYLKEWTRALKKHAAPLCPTPIKDITTDMIVDVLKPVFLKRPVAGRMARPRIYKVFEWAKSNGWFKGDNPARWKGHLEDRLPKRKGEVRHHGGWHYRDAHDVMRRLQALDEPMARFVELLFWTALRRGEVLGGRWEEIDWDARVWKVPGSRMKMKKEHKVPLSDPAIECLHRMQPQQTGRMFAPYLGTRDRSGLAYHSLKFLRVTLEGGPDKTLHGSRSTFRSWGQDVGNYPREVLEFCLAHVEGSEAEIAYTRGDMLEKRRIVMEAWAAYVMRTPVPKVVHLRG
jgi:integrase